jgi:hypothetical protein
MVIQYSPIDLSFPSQGNTIIIYQDRLRTNLRERNLFIFTTQKGGVFPYRYRCTTGVRTYFGVRRHKDYPHYDGMDLDSYQCPEAIYLAVYLRDMTGSYNS